jgi:GIY-YIG catalytic domain
MVSFGQTSQEEMIQGSVKNLTINSRFAKSTYLPVLWRKSIPRFLLVLAFWVLSVQQLTAERNDNGIDDATLVESFAQSHDGFSSDEVLINQELRTAFFTALSARGVKVDSEQAERDALLALLALRKTGKLQVTAIKRGPSADDMYLPIAEIASRVVLDRHRVSSDTMLADPRLRKEFFDEAAKLGDATNEYQIAKSVLRLRKIRQLKPELVLRVADWDRVVSTLTAKELSQKIAAGEIPKSPGIYLFRDATGYLYIGEAENLEVRLQQHLGGSDRIALADYLKAHTSSEITVELHIFPKDSPASRLAVRRAYESELIRSRAPKFNVRP